MDSLERGLRACGRLVRQGAGEAEWEFVLPGEFVGFAGHFPGNPVLPAIAQLAMVRLAAGDALPGGPRPLRLAAVKRAKFTAPVGPGQAVRVACSLTEDRGCWTARASVQVGIEVAASLVLALEEAGKEP
ncbi:MAG: hypothetical protein AB1916_07090 [Thermodesulfobacteriota bacterium]